MNLALLKKEAQETAKRLEDRLAKAIEEDRDLSEEEETSQAEDQTRLDRQMGHIRKFEAIAEKTASLIATPSDPAATPVPLAAVPLPQMSSDGFAHLAEFAQAVRLANPAAGQSFRMDDRLAAPANVTTEEGDGAGSFLVPAQFRQEIVDLVFEDEDPMMQLFDPSPTGSNRVVGLGDETTPWGTSGIQAYWRSESDQMTPSKAALTPRETKLNELYAFVLATDELLEDAPRIADLLGRKAAGAIRWKAGGAIMNGDGIEKPKGYLGSDALVTVAKEGGQTADTIVPKNVARMYSRVINPAQSVWLANADILPSIMDFESPNGQMLWHSDYSEGPGGRLLGRPVFWTEHAKTVGDLGDLQLVNPKGYEAFKKVGGVKFADSIHLYFDYNIRAFRWIFRIGGQPVLTAPVTPANGANTKSHFVALAERA